MEPVETRDTARAYRVRELLGGLGADGLLQNEQDQATYQKYRDELAKAEADPAFDTVPGDFQAFESDEATRLENWRRLHFRALTEAEFQCLRLLKRVLDKSNNHESL